MNQKQLKKIIKGIEKKTNTYQPEVETAYNLMKQSINKELDELNNFIIPELLENIKRKRSGIPLIVKVNDINTPAKKLDIKVYAFAKDNVQERISLLNSESSIIQKPVKYTYNELGGIVVSYKNQDYIFISDEKNLRLPKKLKEMKNPASKYSFEDIDRWIIYIDEKDDKITISLLSVEEFTVTKKRN